MASCDDILKYCKDWIGERLQITTLGDSCILRMPFSDSSGDPITLVVSDAPDGYLVHDGGVIAGHLFSLGQHTENTLAFKLLTTLCETYNLTLDRDHGLIKANCSHDNLGETILELTKVVLTITTATAHISVQPHRFRTLGARVKRKVRDHYAQRKILDWVEPYYEIPGQTVDVWPIDFHWKIHKENSYRDVLISTIDLNVADPIKKVEHITALVIDAHEVIEGNEYRVVLDKHGQNSMADVAANYLEEHGERLGYTLYDFGDAQSRDRFIAQSELEILGEAGAEWRDFWAAAKSGQIDAGELSRDHFNAIVLGATTPLGLPSPDQEPRET